MPPATPPEPSTWFAMLGVAGFVAPRHLAAIGAVGGELVAACDPNDSVGIIDSYFPEARFFTEFERFDRYLDKLRRQGHRLDYLTVCSPNYLHDAHTRFGLRSGADVICEKPLVLNPWNLDGLAEIEAETGRRVFTILQLRHHPAIVQLAERVRSGARADYAVDLRYITSRGNWYHASWKGDEAKSGGVATNIGIHLFDMLSMVFGKVTASVLHLRESSRMAGRLHFERATVNWFLSVDAADLPADTAPNRRTYRSITVDGEAFEFSDGFEDLHTISYRSILDGNGFGIDVVRPSIELVSTLRTCPVDPDPAALADLGVVGR